MPKAALAPYAGDVRYDWLQKKLRLWSQSLSDNGAVTITLNPWEFEALASIVGMEKEARAAVKAGFKKRPRAKGGPRRPKDDEGEE